MTSVLVHATTVQIAGHGVLILGDSGSGKSDLALRLIGEGALLVADDQTRVTCRDGQLVATAPATIAGRLEARGIGILAAPQVESARLRLAVRLSTIPVERMPEALFWYPPGGVAETHHLQMIALAPFEPSALVKLRMALNAVLRA
jgi:serine kinase of HPr protein (carbohydrate metabolism regulator)